MENEFKNSVLLQAARDAADAAHCPYSHFPVGAAVETELGVFRGCNVENASYGLTVCAERVALWTAIAAGARTLRRLAVCCRSAQTGAPPGSRMPCGACRQVMAELMTPDSVILVDGAGVWTLAQLLPDPFALTAEAVVQGT